MDRTEVQRFTVVGIPAFNEEKTIAQVVLKTQKHADKVVVCDDGSSDLTGEISERLGAEVIGHERNLGYGAAIQSLFRRAKELGADVLVTLDADGQHDPNDIPSVMQPLMQDEADIVIGSRFLQEHSRKQMSWHRRTGINFITKLTDNIAKHGIMDAQSGFRAYNSKSLEQLTMLENGMGASVEILMHAGKCGLRVKEVYATCNYDDRTRKRTRNPISHGAEVIMSIVRLVVEDRPLTFMGVPGIICLAIGAIFGVWMLQIYALEHRIVTNIALASIAFTFIGFFALSTAVTLYAISRLVQQRIGRHEDVGN